MVDKGIQKELLWDKLNNLLSDDNLTDLWGKVLGYLSVWFSVFSFAKLQNLLGTNHSFMKDNPDFIVRSKLAEIFEHCIQTKTPLT